LSNALSNLLKGFLEKTGREQNKIKFPPEYYETSTDLKENLCKYKVALEQIKTKYEGYLLKDTLDKRYSGLSQKKITKYENRIDEKINDEVEYARLMTLYRLGDVTKPGLKKLVRLAEIYDSPKMAAMFKNKFKIIQTQRKLIDVKNLVRRKIADDLMRDITYNVKPDGVRAEFPIDWVKKLNMLNSELEKRGLVLDGQGQENKIREIWSNICRDAEQSFRTNLQEKEAQATLGRERDSSPAPRTRDLVIFR
jgi:hypothetical protein